MSNFNHRFLLLRNSPTGKMATLYRGNICPSKREKGLSSITPPFWWRNILTRWVIFRVSNDPSHTEKNNPMIMNQYMKMFNAVRFKNVHLKILTRQARLTFYNYCNPMKVHLNYQWFIKNIHVIILPTAQGVALKFWEQFYIPIVCFQSDGKYTLQLQNVYW